MPNYSNSIIYKLCCNDPAVLDIYVGSTTSFRARKCAHKNTCHNENNKDYQYYLYQFIRANGGFSNWDMIQIERYDAKDKLDLLARERHYLELLGATLNRNVPGRTMKEYYRDTKEERSVYEKQYYKEHKQKHNEYTKQHYKDEKNIQVCICGSSYNYGKSHCRNRHYRTQRHQNHIQLIQTKLLGN